MIRKAQNQKALHICIKSGGMNDTHKKEKQEKV